MILPEHPEPLRSVLISVLLVILFPISCLSPQGMQEESTEWAVQFNSMSTYYYLVFGQHDFIQFKLMQNSVLLKEPAVGEMCVTDK